MVVLQKDRDAFESATTELFSFLESDFQMRYAGVSVKGDDPRDACVVAKYRQDEFRVDVAWNPFAMSLGVLLKVSHNDLGRRERYVYLEPFIEFISNGKTPPIVPQIYLGMSVKKIEKSMEQRQQLFRGGVNCALAAIAERLREHLTSIRDCSADTIRQYQAWYQLRGKSV